jgi:oligopeptide transport system permease protein
LFKRILIGVFSLFVLASVAFFLTRLMPGSPFESGNSLPLVQEEMEREYGLDKPLLEQYLQYLSHLLRGDLGISYKKPGVAVADVISRAFPVTLKMGGLAVLLSLVTGTGLGIWQAATKRAAVCNGIFFMTMMGSGVLNFVWGSLFVWLFGLKWKLLPVVGIHDWKSFLLPVLTMAIYPTCVVTRLTRNSFRREMEKDYVVLAKAKGLLNVQIIGVHILKNACLPVLQYMGPAAAFLLTGSFVVESIFTIPGLGREFVNSIANRDYTLILGLTVFMGAVVIGLNLLTDLLCACLSPATRTGMTGAGR